MKSWITQGLLPVVGLLTLGYGGYVYWSTPTAKDLAVRQDERAQLAAELQELQQEPMVGPGMFAEQLPDSLQVGVLLQKVQQAADRCQVKRILFDVQPPEESVAGQKTIESAPPPGGAGDPQAATDPKAALQMLRRVRCRFDLEAGYPQLVRFLGLLENMPPSKVVRGLDLQTRDGLVVAEVEVEFHYLPQKENG